MLCQYKHSHNRDHLALNTNDIPTNWQDCMTTICLLLSHFVLNQRWNLKMIVDKGVSLKTIKIDCRSYNKYYKSIYIHQLFRRLIIKYQIYVQISKGTIRWRSQWPWNLIRIMIKAMSFEDQREIIQ